jgi:Zn finger protein HypA/HybF involved in hydrogenase expression
MHEFSVAESIIEEARGSCKCEPLAIVLEVGELANLTKQEIKDTMKLLVNWKIEFLDKKGMISCLNCRYKGKPKILERYHMGVLIECPKCKGRKVRIIEGEKIILKKVKTK